LQLNVVGGLEHDFYIMVIFHSYVSLPEGNMGDFLDVARISYVIM
jgi:hypothetical protein